MPILSAAQLSKLYALQDLAMPGTAVIQRQTLTGGYGAEAGPWVAVGTASCRMSNVDPKPGKENIAGGQVTAVVEYIYTMPVDTDVMASDRILYANRLFEVRSVNNDSTRKTAIRAVTTSVDSR